MVHDPENGFKATLGNYNITTYHNTERAVLAKLPKGDIDTLLTIMSVVAENVYNILKERTQP